MTNDTVAWLTWTKDGLPNNYSKEHVIKDEDPSWRIGWVSTKCGLKVYADKVEIMAGDEGFGYCRTCYKLRRKRRTIK